MPRTHNRTGRARKHSGDTNIAPGSSIPLFRRRNKIMEQFAARTISMLRSPAFCVLSLSGRRILDRLEIELAAHGGKDNGALPCTFDDFENYGIHRHAIAAGLREAQALGFIEITRVGRAGNADFRRPHLYRITYKPTENAPQTDEWRRIDTIENAEMSARTARKAVINPQRKNRTPVAESALRPVAESALQTGNSIV